MAPVKVILYRPDHAEGWVELEKRVSDIHASAVTRQIKALNCPTSQKWKLLDTVIETIQAESREQT